MKAVIRPIGLEDITITMEGVPVMKEMSGELLRHLRVVLRVIWDK